MPFSLTTIASGVTTSATVLRGHIQTIYKYVNEEIALGDLQVASPWVESSHIFGPEFFGSPAPRVELSTGEIHWRRTTGEGHLRAIHHDTPNEAVYVPVPGLQWTGQVSESMNTTDPDFRAVVIANFAAYEYGGSGLVDEIRDHVADFRLYIDGSARTATTRELYTASDSLFGADYRSCGVITARKNISMMASAVLSQGVHHAGVYISVRARTNLDANVIEDWRHVFVAQRNLVVDWYMR